MNTFVLVRRGNAFAINVDLYIRYIGKLERVVSDQRFTLSPHVRQFKRVSALSLIFLLLLLTVTSKQYSVLHSKTRIAHVIHTHSF